MNWSFAIINGRLAEIFFERKRERIIFIGHCYVDESEYKTRIEKKWIKNEMARVRLVYRKGEYKKLPGIEALEE